MSNSIDDQDDRGVAARGRPLRLAAIWRVGAFVAASLAAAAYLSGACCGVDARVPRRVTLIGHAGMVRSVVFRPGGAMLASVGTNGSIALWDLRRGMGRPLPPAAPGQDHCVAFSPDGRLLATGGAGGGVVLHDLASPAEQAPDDASGVGPALGVDVGAGAKCLAFSPDGRSLAVGRDDGRIALWDVSARRVRSELAAHPEVVSSLAFSPDGRTFASSGGDRVVRLWDAATGRERQEIPGQPSMLVALAFSPDGRILALADQRNAAVRLWDVAAGAERATLYGEEGVMVAVAISPDGSTVAAADFHGQVHYWHLDSHRPGGRHLEHAGVQAVAFSPDGRTLATGGFDGSIYLWDWPPEAQTD